MSAPDNDSSLRRRLIQLEEARQIIAELKSNISVRRAEHARFMQLHEETMKRIDARLDRMSARDKVLDARIEQLDSAIGSLFKPRPLESRS